MKSLRLFLALALAGLLTAAAHAQITVDLSIKRRMFIAHEPIVATVTITNRTGRDITLADTPGIQWFAFQVLGAGERIYPPRNPDYTLEPIEIKAGAQKQRTVNLHELYEISEFGIYRIRASIYFADFKKFFSSRATGIEVTDGQLIWTQTVGVPDGQPDGGSMRKFTLLAHQQADYKMLYIRVEDRESGAVYCTQELGRMIEGQPPLAEFDLGNNLYVLQLIGQREHLLSKIGLNGAYLGGTRYTAPKTRPYFRKLADGQLQIVGGKRVAAIEKDSTAEAPTKLSQRPPGLPTN